MWCYSNCEVQGRGHIKNNIPCQDKTLSGYKNGVYVIALADGSSSAKYSHYGAECVIETISELLFADFESLFNSNNGAEVKYLICDIIKKRLETLSEKNNCSINDFASTMLVAAIRNDMFIIAHIGDGVVGYFDGSNLKVASAPSNGKYANETYYITSNDAIAHLNIFKGEIKNISGFVLMSDGTACSLYNKQYNTINPSVLKLLKHNLLIDKKAMCCFLSKIFESTIKFRTNDDCSIALLSKSSESLKTFNNLSFTERRELYGIKNDNIHYKKRVNRYDVIINLLDHPVSLSNIAKAINLSKKHTKKNLEHLKALGLLGFKDGKYFSLLSKGKGDS